MKLTIDEINKIIESLVKQKEQAAMDVSMAQRGFQNAEGALSLAREILSKYELEKGGESAPSSPA